MLGGEDEEGVGGVFGWDELPELMVARFLLLELYFGYAC